MRTSQTTTGEVPWRRGHPSQLRLAGLLRCRRSQVFVDFMAKVPEDRATTMGRTVNEPAGKKTYLGGLLTWRKLTTQAVGCTHARS